MQNIMKTFLLVMFFLAVTLSACTGSMPSDEISLRTATSTILPASPTAEPTPTHTPSPTPTPLELVDEGDHALFVGDYDTAREIFQNTLNQAKDPAVRAQSQLGLGQAWYRLGEFGLALDQFELAAEVENPVTAVLASYMLGKPMHS